MYIRTSFVRSTLRVSSIRIFILIDPKYNNNQSGVWDANGCSEEVVEQCLPQAWACRGFLSLAVSIRTRRQYCSHWHAPSEARVAEYKVGFSSSYVPSGSTLPPCLAARRRGASDSILNVSSGTVLDPPGTIDTGEVLLGRQVATTSNE